MTLSDFLALLEIVLLIRILWQGELIVKYERGVYEIHTTKEQDHKKWREAKRKAALKKLDYEVAVVEAKLLETAQEEKNEETKTDI